MPHELKPQTGEPLLLDISYRLSPKAEPFRFALSHEAVYLSARKFAVSGGSGGFRRVPHAQVRRVSVENARPVQVWGLSLLLICASLALVALWLVSASWHALPIVLGAALALAAGGILTPWATQGQQRLKISLTAGTYYWNPPSFQDRQAKQQVQDLLESILDTCRSVGLQVLYEAEPDRQRLV